jgi:hypothetical protein
VIISGPCPVTAYSADRKAIPQTTDNPGLIKYQIGDGSDELLPFAFNFLPISCNFFKTYSLSVVKYPSLENVPSFIWITANES